MITKPSLKNLKQVEVAALLGVSDRWIRQLNAEGLPGTGEGPRRVYDWAKVLPWWIARSSGAGSGGKAPTDRQRREKAEADLAEMERDQKAGSLIPVAEARAGLEDLLTRLRTNLLGFTDRVVPLLEEAQDTRERLAIGKREMKATLRCLVAAEQERDQEQQA